MGSLFAKHFAKRHTLFLCDHHYDHAAALGKEIKAESYKKARDAVKHADLIFLAIKPADLMTVSDEIKDYLPANPLIVSILAGTPLSLLKKTFPECAILRMLPNLAISHGEGVLGLVEDPSLSADWHQKMESLFEGLGLIYWLPEEKIDALTAFTGSGPAFIFVLIEAMIDSGVLLGFSHQEARELALKTVQGSIVLLEKTTKTPVELKWQVASPKGTTIEGLKALEESGFKTAVINAFVAAYQRAKEMQR